MNKRTWNRIGLWLLFLSSSVFFLLAYTGFEKGHIKLSDCERLTGTILQEGVEIRQPYRGDRPFYFYITLKQFPNREFTFYQSSRRYEMLLYALKVEDTVTVYVVKEAFHGNATEYELIQLEKEGEIIIHQKLNRKKGNVIFGIGLGAGTIAVLSSIWGLTKSFRRKRASRLRRTL